MISEAGSLLEDLSTVVTGTVEDPPTTPSQQSLMNSKQMSAEVHSPVKDISTPEVNTAASQTVSCEQQADVH